MQKGLIGVMAVLACAWLVGCGGASAPAADPIPLVPAAAPIGVDCSGPSGTGWCRQQPSSAQAEDPGFDYLGLWFADAQRGLALGSDGLLRATEDGGRTWQARPAVGSPLAFGGSLQFTPDRVGWMVLGRQLYRSEDEGRTWQERAIPLEIGAWIEGVQFVDASHGWLIGKECTQHDGAISCDAMLHATADGGQTWKARGSINSDAMVRFADASVGVMKDYDNAIYRTADGGLSWTPVEPDDAPAGGLAVAIYFRTPNEGWLVSQSVHRVALRTINGGLTWTSVSLPVSSIDIVAIHFADERTGWMVGKDGCILNTRDGGATWTQQASGTTRALYTVHAPGGLHVWAAGMQGTVVATSTGGD